MDTWHYTTQVVHVDGEDIKLPTWVGRQPLMPPSRSPLRRQDVLEHVQAEGNFFDNYADGMKQIEFNDIFMCGICFGYLHDPVLCSHTQCKFRACHHCISVHYKRDKRCPTCRREAAEPKVDVQILPYLAEELRRHGIRFHCNLDPPGSHAGALWCCKRSFDNIADFKLHVSQQWSFLSTHLECKRRLTSIISSGVDGGQIAEEMREQLRYVMMEDAVLIHAARRHRDMLQEHVLLHLGKSYRSTTRETETCMYPEVAAEDLLEGASRVQDAFAAVVQNVGNMIASIRARSRSPRRSAEIEDFEAAVQDVGNMIASIRARSRSPRRSAEIEDSSSDTD